MRCSFKYIWLKPYKRNAKNLHCCEHIHQTRSCRIESCIHFQSFFPPSFYMKLSFFSLVLWINLASHLAQMCCISFQFSSDLHSLWINRESDGMEKRQMNTLFWVEEWRYIQNSVLENVSYCFSFCYRTQNVTGSWSKTSLNVKEEMLVWGHVSLCGSDLAHSYVL